MRTLLLVVTTALAGELLVPHDPGPTSGAIDRGTVVTTML